MMIDIYTCITAGYDDLKKQPSMVGVRYTAFMEGIVRPQPPWAILRMPPLGVALGPADTDPTRRAREVKALSHVVLPEAECSLWLDGCFVIRQDFRVSRWVGEFLDKEGVDLVTFQHPKYDCTYAHADAVIKFELDSAVTVARQMQRYKTAGFPEHAGMVQTNVILRRHTDAVRRFNEKWWEEIRGGSRRDQLSFVYAARETGLKYASLPLIPDSQYFQGKSHRGARTKP